MKGFPRTIRNVGKSESVLDESRILVAFKKATNTNKVQQLAKELGLKLESGERAQEGRLRVEVNHTDKRYWLRSADNSHINDDDIKRDDEYSLVVFQTNENNEILGGATAIYKVAR